MTLSVEFTNKNLIKSYELNELINEYIVNENIDALKKRMPFKIGIERDTENKEELSITSIVDKNGNDVLDSNLEIHIQSLGVDEKYWLDSGAFDF